MSMVQWLKKAALLALVLALSLCALAEELPVPAETDELLAEIEIAPFEDAVEAVDDQPLEIEADFGAEDEDVPLADKEGAQPAEAEVVMSAEPEGVQFDAAQDVVPEQDTDTAQAVPTAGEDNAQATEGENTSTEAPAEVNAETPAEATVETTQPAATVDALPTFTGNAKRVPVLTYHMVLTDDLKQTNRFAKDRYSVSVSTFDRQMAWLRKRNYTAVTCEQLYLWHEGKLRLPKKSVLITLDDGYASTIENIIPILEKYGLRATEFIIGSASYEGRPGFVTLDRIQQIRAQHSCLEFQSHTWALHRKTAYKTERYAAFASDAAAQRDIYGFQYIAYPYGKNSKAMRKAYRNNGIRMAFLFGSSNDGYATRKQNLLKMKRIEIKGGMSMRKFKRWCK